MSTIILAILSILAIIGGAILAACILEQIERRMEYRAKEEEDEEWF